MGYACPVCSDPQADAGHLANHLAFTAILGDDDHERWLDEHVPGWGEMGEADLADAVVELVEETEFPQLFEDASGHGHRHGPGDGHAGHAHVDSPDPVVTTGQMDETTAEVLEEARELTRRMHADGDDGSAAEEGGNEGKRDVDEHENADR